MEQYNTNTDEDINRYYNIWIVYASQRLAEHQRLYRMVTVDGLAMVLAFADGIRKPYSFWATSAIDITPNTATPFTIHIRGTGAWALHGCVMPELMDTALERITVAISAAKKGYKIQFLGTEDALWIENNELYYVIRIVTPNGKHMFLDLKATQMFPPLDLDQVYRETKLKRPSTESVDSLREWVSADIKP